MITLGYFSVAVVVGYCLSPRVVNIIFFERDATNNNASFDLIGENGNKIPSCWSKIGDFNFCLVVSLDHKGGGV